jgi:hypothetical protein
MHGWLAAVMACGCLVGSVAAQAPRSQGQPVRQTSYHYGYVDHEEEEAAAGMKTPYRFGGACDACDSNACDAGCGIGSGCGIGNWGGAGGGAGGFSGYGCPCNGGGGSPFGATVSLKQDSFFGFHTILGASYRMNQRMDFTFYSILWTTPLFGFDPVNAPGLGLWTEVGTGFNFRFLNDKLSFNPQIGVLNGTLLSGAVGSRVRSFEGVVPNFTTNWDGDYTEAEAYFGYYLATRGNDRSDFVHWWINGGIKPFADSRDWKQIISTGLHYENLVATRANATVYAWLGPYVQFKLPNDLSLRFATGWDTANSNQDFYQATVSYSF